jgi:hypothetical protein
MTITEAAKYFENECDHECLTGDECPLNIKDEEGITACAHLNAAEALVYHTKITQTVSPDL